MSLREAEVDIKIRGIVTILPNQKIENTFFKNHLNPKTIKDVTRITGVKLDIGPKKIKQQIIYV